MKRSRKTIMTRYLLLLPNILVKTIKLISLAAKTVPIVNYAICVYMIYIFLRFIPEWEVEP